jgi:hypothetical protein
MNDALRSVLLGTSGLAFAASVALAFSLYRSPVNVTSAVQHRTTALIATCLVLQSAHFVEEYATRFYQRFPSLVGLAPWTVSFFVAFNVFWLIVWALAVRGVRSGSRVAFFALWFFAVAMIANGIAHPLLAVHAGGYFPGLITAPVLGIAGIALWLRLMSLTRPPGQKPARPARASEVR